MSKIFHSENDAFTQRLILALNNIGYEIKNINRITIDINKLFDDKSITTHAVRKWLSGQTIPIHSRLLRLAGWLGVSPSWLRFGEGDMYKLPIESIHQSNDSQFSLLFAKIKSLSKEELILVVNQVELILKIRKNIKN